MRAIKNIRLKEYNYKSDGYYFVTIVCNNRQNYLSGKNIVVEKALIDLEGKINGLNVDYFITMSYHVHIIFVLHTCNIGLGEIVRRFKAKVSYLTGNNVWQPNYYEHIIRSDKALEKIREYIVNNPQELLLKFDQFYK